MPRSLRDLDHRGHVSGEGIRGGGRCGLFDDPSRRSCLGCALVNVELEDSVGDGSLLYRAFQDIELERLARRRGRGVARYASLGKIESERRWKIGKRALDERVDGLDVFDGLLDGCDGLLGRR